MRRFLILGLIGMLVTALVPPAQAAPGPKAKPPKPLKVKVYGRGDAFCPPGVLVFGRVVIAAGRCYTLFIVRQGGGSFLAFAAPEARIPPGQLVRLTTPAGAKLRGRIFYLVPLSATAVWIPLNTMTLVAVRVEDFGPRVVVLLTDRPGVSVTFTVRL
jgi:hypothetical protein